MNLNHQLPPLRAVRLARGLGLRETADRADLDAGHLSRVERGRAELSVPALYRLAGVLGLRELEKLLALYVRERRPHDRDKRGQVQNGGDRL